MFTENSDSSFSFQHVFKDEIAKNNRNDRYNKKMLSE